jgi:O-antigen/teichoic acid export membrane protein
MNIAMRIIGRLTHSSWALIDQASVSASNFLTGILLARIIGLDQFGRFTLAWTTLLLIQSLQYAAISMPMMTMGPKQQSADQPTYYGVVAVQQAIFLFFTVLISWSGAETASSMRPEWGIQYVLLPFIASIGCCLTHDFLRRYFFALGRPHLSFAADAIRYSVQIAVLILYFSFAWPADSGTALWIIASSALLSSLLICPFMSKLSWSWSVFSSISIRKWHFAKWTVASAVLSWATGNFFIVTSGALLGATVVGGMRAAQNIVGITHLIFQGLENVVPAEAARRVAIEGPFGVASYLRRVAVGGGLATTAMASIFVIAPTFWLGLLFGPNYSSYGYLVKWWAAYEVLTFFSLPLGAWLRTLEKTRFIFYSNTVTALVSLALAYPMIQQFGSVGALAGMLIAAATQIIVLTLGGRRASLAQTVTDIRRRRNSE